MCKITDCRQYVTKATSFPRGNTPPQDLWCSHFSWVVQHSQHIDNFVWPNPTTRCLKTSTFNYISASLMVGSGHSLYAPVWLVYICEADFE